MGESDWNAPTQAVQAPRTPAQPPVAAPDPWAQQRPISPYPPPAPTWNGPAYQQPQPPPVSQAALSPRRKPRRWPWYFLLTLVILAGIISATWLLFLRPIVHQDAETQIRRGLQAGVNQVPVSVAQDAQAGVPFLISEDQMNTYLASQLSNLAPISEIHVSLQPGVMVVTLNTFGLGSTVRLGLGLEDGRLVAQQVDVSGLLWWVENGSELTPLINDSLRQVQDRLGRPILAVSIQSGTLAAIFN